MDARRWSPDDRERWGSFAESPDDACLKVPVGGGRGGSRNLRAILRVAHEPDWAAAIGTRARAFAAEAHSFERAAAGYRAVIEAVAGESGENRRCSRIPGRRLEVRQSEFGTRNLRTCSNVTWRDNR